MRSLNPYSTGSNSNTLTAFEILRLFILCVLILILLEVTQIQRKTERETERFRLNPYSTGSNSNTEKDGKGKGKKSWYQVRKYSVS